MNKLLLQEYLAPSKARTVMESTDDGDGKKSLYMKGIFIEGDVRNANQRIYPLHEIKHAVTAMNQIIKEHGGICGELDHPDDLKINLDRVSHMITEMWMDGNAGCGKLKILPTPMGNIIKVMLESGVKLGVSSRGSGNVSDHSGHVSDFGIITVDVVCNPSAPNAYPQPIYESLLNMKHGHKVLTLAEDVQKDARLQKYLQKEMINVIKKLKL